jgi:ribokinase
MRKKILVLGSSNVDLILRIPRFHNPGETMTAESLVTAFGGKGANQAIAAKRLGGDVIFVTKLGSDEYGKFYVQYLTQNGLHPKWILRDKKLPTGLALIELTPEGENRIIVSPGANASLSEMDLKRLGSLWTGVEIFVTQLEIPIQTVKRGLTEAKRHGAITLLNPSPPARSSADLLHLADFVVLNETEAQVLAGIKVKGIRDIRFIGEKLLEMGARNVVMTLGPGGIFFKNEKNELSMKAFKVNVLDTTAAGDAFMGGLACGLAEDMPAQKLLRFASAAGALAATKVGAQPSLPSRKEVNLLLLCG